MAYRGEGSVVSPVGVSRRCSGDGQRVGRRWRKNIKAAKSLKSAPRDSPVASLFPLKQCRHTPPSFDVIHALICSVDALIMWRTCTFFVPPTYPPPPFMVASRG